MKEQRKLVAVLVLKADTSRLGYLAVFAERGQLSWSFNSLQPKSKLKALIAEER